MENARVQKDKILRDFRTILKLQRLNQKISKYNLLKDVDITYPGEDINAL